MSTYGLENISIRKMQDIDTDYELILKWYKNPTVTEYFNPIIETKQEAILKYRPHIHGESNVIPCIIELNKKPVGYVQYYPIGKEDKEKFNLLNYRKVYGIDIFIGEKNLYSKGIGSASLKILVNYLFLEKDVEMVIIDPEVKNKIAINSYKKAGFIPYLKTTEEEKEKLILYVKSSRL